MARPRAFDYEQIVAAAKEVFWDRGYEGTSVDDLEHATGLNRSSLYRTFETKLGLFQAALDDYEHSFIAMMLGPVEAEGAGLEDAAGFFRALADLFGDPQSARGCLQINSITELAGRVPALAHRGAQFADRYRSAFAHALAATAPAGTADNDTIVQRAELLASAAMGAWVAARADHEAAARTCLAVAAQIEPWARPFRGRRTGPRAQGR
jgi:TetR/AcrR family transcriptional regulator, transcriptional repressor for nem operon